QARFFCCAPTNASRVFTQPGSFTSLWLLGSTVRMSASHPKATESLRSSEMTLSATSGLMHRSKRSSSCTAIRSPRRRGQKRRRHVEAERLRHDQVNEVELGRLLDRKIGGLRPPQNLVD